MECPHPTIKHVHCSDCGGCMSQVKQINLGGGTVLIRTDGLTQQGQTPFMCEKCIMHHYTYGVLPTWIGIKA